MDITRDTSGLKRRRIMYGGLLLLVVVLITVGLSRLERAAPGVEEATLYLDVVKRGELVLERRGTGTLVPEEVRAITARTAGRVEEIVLLPGAGVGPETVVLRLSNPDVELAARTAEWELLGGEATLRDLRVRLDIQRLQQRSAAAGVQADFRTAQLEAERDEQLYAEGLISDLTMQLSRTRAEELAQRHEIEQERLLILEDSIAAQLELEKTRVDRLRAQYELAGEDLEGLEVRARIPGVLQEMPMEVGQSVSPGTVLARVVQPEKLKAELRIPEVQAKDVQVGQQAVVDIRTAKIPGRVTRIDPAATQGSVIVDVELLMERLPGGRLPEGARPQMNVDGTIEITRLPDVLYVGKPAYGQSNSRVQLFKVLEDGVHAGRVTVEFGLSSVNQIEVVMGLVEGDEVILSDMSRFDAVDRVRLR